MRLFILYLVLAFFGGPSIVRADFQDAQRNEVSFSSGREDFVAYVYKPQGKGPFPAVIWVHGHADHMTKSSASEYDDLAKLYTREGFVLFIPDRHMADISHANYSPELQKLLGQDPKGVATQRKQALEILDINAQDVIAATEWLKKQSYVDVRKLTLSGWAYGSSLCVLAAEKKREDFRALALFYAPWSHWSPKAPAQPVFIRAIRNCSAPVFAIRATDDPAPDAFKALAGEVKKKPGNKTQEYVHSGYDNRERDSLAVNGCDAWGYDVLRFFENACKN